MSNKGKYHKHHNKGQSDAKRGKHSKPYNPLGGWFASDYEAKSNDAYNKGWRNNRK